MRLLLDEGASPRLARALRERGHVADLAVEVGFRAAPDDAILARAAAYDALITYDMFRQASERRSAARAMLGGLRILRVRQRNDVRRLGYQQTVIAALPALERALSPNSDVRLLIIDPKSDVIRMRTASQIAAMLLEPG